MNPLSILHTSDVHGDLDLLFRDSGEYYRKTAEVCIDTGDFFPNWNRGISAYERDFQTMWLEEHYPELRAHWLRDRPLIYVPGNHDAVSLATLLRALGYPAPVLEVTPEGHEFKGIRFAGFREISAINWEWMGEATFPEIRALCEKIQKARPDVLVTHAPPAGVLTSALVPDYGLTAIANYISGLLGECTAKYHLFGHSHVGGGESQQVCDTFCINGARHVKSHNLFAPVILR